MFFFKRKQLYLNVLLIIIGTLLLFKAPIDPDFGWHYKYGEYLFNNHKILRDNIFSYTFTDYKWADSYWAAEVIIYVLYTFAGPVALSLIFGGLLSTTFV